MDYHREKGPNRPTVLIVEDDIVLRQPLADYLRSAGYTILEAANATEAIAVFAAEIPIDIVFSDIRMAGPMDGLALARWIHRRHPGIRIALTSGAGRRAARAEDAVQIFVPKPYRVGDVASRIDQLWAESARPGSPDGHGLPPQGSTEAPTTKKRRRSPSRRAAKPRSNGSN